MPDLLERSHAMRWREPHLRFLLRRRAGLGMPFRGAGVGLLTHDFVGDFEWH